MVLVAERGNPRYREFNRRTTYVQELFAFSLPRIETSAHFKIFLVALADHGSAAVWRDNGEVAHLERPFDFDAFWVGTEEVRREMALEFILSGCLEVAKRMGWPMEAFEAARDEVIRREFRLEDRVGKPVTSSGGRTAELWYRSGPVKADVEIRVSGPISLEEVVIPVAETDPHSFKYTRYLGHLKWVADNQIELRMKGDRRQLFEVPDAGGAATK